MRSGNRRVLALVTDAYGGWGGIAAYNRDVLEALSADPSIERVVALARVGEGPLPEIPEKIDFEIDGKHSVLTYIRLVLGKLRPGRFDLIYCGHIHLVPLAWLASKLTGAPWVLCLCGVEAWERIRHRGIGASAG